MVHGIRPLAEFARLGIQHHLLNFRDVVAWADGLIEDSDCPAEWLIDLALAKRSDINQLLQQVPGQSDADLAISLLMGLLNRRWRSSNLAIMDVCEISWALHVDYERPQQKGAADWGCLLNHYVEEIEAGLRTVAELEASITEKLQEYSDFEHALPNWVGQFVASPAVIPSREAVGELPTERDFDPTARDPDARWAWNNFGGLSIEAAARKLRERPDIYPEAFDAMDGKAFAFYFSAIDMHLRTVPPHNEDGDDYGAVYLAGCIENHFQISRFRLVLHLTPRILDLLKYMRDHIGRFADDVEARHHILNSWAKLETRVTTVTQLSQPRGSF